MADMAMDFASILSAEYADKMMAAGTPDVIDREPIGTGPFQFVSYQKDAVIRYKAFDAALGRPAEDRQPGVRDHHRRIGALRQAEDRRVPRDGVPEAGRRRPDEERSGDQPGVAARPQRRLHRLQRREEAVRFDKLVRQALNLAVNKKAILDNVFQGAGQVGQEPDPADALVVQRQGRRLPVRPDPGEGAAGAGRLSERRRRRALVLAGDAAVQPRRQAHGRADPADWEKVGVRRPSSSPTSGASTGSAARPASSTR